ncbi:MAG: DUF5666 domain-containing protein [Woeseiaceae bacterium]
MKQRAMKYETTFAPIGMALLLSLNLAACGGSGGSADTTPVSPSATEKSVVGQITGFGSVYVNGVEYETDGTSYDVDDTSASDDSSLAVGMVVKVQGAVNADGRTGIARSISYDDEVEGLVEELATDADDPSIKTFSVMNTLVRVDQSNTNFDGEDDAAFSFDTIMNGDNVEVSGEYDGDILVASYVEKQDSADDDFEAKGTVSEYDDAGNFVLVLKNGSTLDVTLAAGASIPSVGIANDQYVEVEGTIPDPVGFPDSLLATKVELEDDDHFGDDDDDEVEVKGILNYNADTEAWSVRDVMIAFSDSTEYKPESLMDSIADASAAGLTVEVEGFYVDGVLQVEEIELEEDELEFKGDATVIESLGPRDGTIQLSFGVATGTVDVVVNSDTMFRDDEAMNHFDLDSITGSAKVEVEGRWAGDGSIIASSLHLEDDLGYEIKGPLGAIDDVSVTVLNVVFSLDENTFFENGIPVDGDYVEVEDEDADGYADSVEIED